MFSHNLRRENVEQGDDSQRKGSPVKTKIQRNTQNGAHQWQNNAQNGFTKDVGEKQDDQQTKDYAKKNALRIIETRRSPPSAPINLTVLIAWKKMSRPLGRLALRARLVVWVVCGTMKEVPPDIKHPSYVIRVREKSGYGIMPGRDQWPRPGQSRTSASITPIVKRLLARFLWRVLHFITNKPQQASDIGPEIRHFEVVVWVKTHLFPRC